MLASSESRGYFREPLAPKVPEITVLFWLIKVLTTGMGESTSAIWPASIGCWRVRP